MSTEKFIERRFNKSSLKIIGQARAIIAEYQRQGFTLTLRQLYYQFVSKDLIANKMTEYKRLGSIINDARLAGLIDWDAIEDRTRNVQRPNTWESPSSIVRAVAQQYVEDLWEGQDHRLEVWIEKDALMGVVEPACNRFQVPFFACRGYSSQSEQYAAGKRFEELLSQGITPVVLHLGDHDPSGVDMSRDNRDRLAMFAYEEVEVRRLALNMDQVQQYRPPPNPAKFTDSRAEGYVREFGKSSWELDALEPSVIDRLITSAVESFIDPDPWAEARKKSEANKEVLTEISSNFEQIKDWLENRTQDEE